MTHNIYDLLDSVATQYEDRNGVVEPALLEGLAAAAMELLADLHELGGLAIRTADGRDAIIMDMTVENDPQPVVRITIS